MIMTLIYDHKLRVFTEIIAIAYMQVFLLTTVASRNIIFHSPSRNSCVSSNYLRRCNAVTRGAKISVWRVGAAKS